MFQPMLPEVAAGIIEMRHVVMPLALVCPNAELIVGRVTELDLDGREATVETDGGLTISIGFDHLVIAVGAAPRAFPIPGHIEHAVGGGFAGVETLAELRDLAQDALHHYPTLKDVPQRWVLVDAAPKILAAIPSRLGQYAADLRGLRFSGLPGWFVARGVHLMLVPGFSRRMRVLADWILSLAFRSDIVTFAGLIDPPPLAGAPTRGLVSAPKLPSSDGGGPPAVEPTQGE